MEVKKTTETVNITPHPSLISKLGATGYRTYEAIAELIDNSIDARIESQTLKVEVNLELKNKTIAVKDNGIGMGFDALRNAMTLAYVEKGKRGKLGWYGLGMKTACSNLGKNFYISTKPVNENKRYECSYREEEWLDGNINKWTTFPINVREDNTDKHGTLITIEGLKVSLYSNLPGNLQDVFEMRYGPILRDKQLEIWVNTLECKPKEPEIIPETKRDFKLELPSGEIVTGWGALLQKRHGPNYGFNLYKNGRLIKMYDQTLLGREAHSAISEIIGDLNFDHVPTMYNKTDFIRESNEFKEIEEIFSTYEEFKNLKKEALQPKYTKEISEYTTEKIKNITLSFLKQVNNVNQDYYDFPQKFKKGSGKKILEYTFDLLGKKEKTIIKLAYLDNIDLKLIKLGPPLEIIINQNSPAYMLTKDKTMFINSQIAESISYAITKKKGLSLEEFLKLSDKFVNASAMEVKRGKTKLSEKKNLKKENESLLLGELQEINEFLKSEFSDEDFYFTATSILEPYLTQVLRTSYYFIYCVGGLGEQINNKLNDKFGDRFLVILSQPSKPKKLDLNYLESFIKRTGINKIIIIREKEREKTYRREGSVASLEIALVDFVSEVENGLPVFSSDINDIILDLRANERLNEKKIHRYAELRGCSSFFEKKVGD